MGAQGLEPRPLLRESSALTSQSYAPASLKRKWAGPPEEVVPTRIVARANHLGLGGHFKPGIQKLYSVSTFTRCRHPPILPGVYLVRRKPCTNRLYKEGVVGRLA